MGSVGAGTENIRNGALVDIDSAAVGELNTFTKEEHGSRIPAVKIQGIGAAGLQQDLSAGLQISAVRMRFTAFHQQGDKVAALDDTDGAARLEVRVGAVAQLGDFWNNRCIR